MYNAQQNENILQLLFWQKYVQKKRGEIFKNKRWEQILGCPWWAKKVVNVVWQSPAKPCRAAAAMSPSWAGAESWQWAMPEENFHEQFLRCANGSWFSLGAVPGPIQTPTQKKEIMPIQISNEAM